MKIKKIRGSKRITPAVMILGVVGAGAIVAFAQSTKKIEAQARVQVNTDRAAPSVAVAMVTPAERKPLSYYTGKVRTDLFTTATPEPPAKPVVLVKPAPPAPPVIVDPFADYAYSGTVTVNDQPMALVENVKTRVGDYYKVGDTFMGAKVANIDDRLLTLDVAGTKKMLSKTDNYSLTPLDKSASFLQPNAQGQPGAVGPNGQPLAMPVDPNNPGAAAAMFQGGRNGMRGNWQNMTPEQMQQMRDRFMNRQFNGGGTGGRGGRGGGFGGGGGFGAGGFGTGFGGGNRRNRGGGGMGGG